MRISQLVIVLLSLVVAAHVRPAFAQAVTDKAPGAKKEPAPVPVAVERGKAALTPKNTTIQFVGLHSGAEPNPRTGYFTNFKGELAIDEATKAPTATSVEIETKSLITPFKRLNDHLQSPDFFYVRKFPKATFQSTKIEAVDAAAGKYKITGDLTLLEVKKSITFPVEVKVSDSGTLLSSKFKLKRSEFGMNFNPDGIVEEVAMTVNVGKTTPKVEVE